MTCTCSDWIGALAQQHAGQLARTARREGASATDALDIVQEAFQRLIGRHDLRDQPEQAARTLTALVRNQARNHRRLHRNAMPHTTELELTTTEQAPDAHLEHHEVATQLASCMSKLGDIHRHIVTMRVLDELSGNETAEQLGLTPSHIAVLLHRAKKELEHCMLTQSPALTPR